ncbi:DUF4136 domain-containing protein [Coraliomargarita algicola]|uniref:DUF4136 domain-containing protein n=1 Tax=Coraliomargarita algicola TaxID=3092156 RepID=A0ABZ0RRG0_9BACT|nr:DUF4136 domain-containing protein [Coraliomargarita sp. J2-16]WPJ95524.1 DUF4136 domain-containing protein [Coraliomargarita sp. J2-16]
MKPAFFLCSLLVINLLTGCMSTPKYSEFTKTINFSSLDTFSYKHTLVTGMDFRKSEEYLLEDLSQQTIVAELAARGFVESDADADFFAVVKWKKSVSSRVNPFDHIDPYNEVMARRDDPSQMFAPRLHLTLEIYETSTGNMFWRKDLPNIFEAIQLTEQRVADSLRRSIENFPQHIEKDPNLPNIE